MLLPYLQFQTFASMKGTLCVTLFSFPKVGLPIYNQIAHSNTEKTCLQHKLSHCLLKLKKLWGIEKYLAHLYKLNK
jgi:hypothetical protein